MGRWKGRGNEYIQFVRVVYCKLPTNSKQLPVFTLEAVPWVQTPVSEVGCDCVTTFEIFTLIQFLLNFKMAAKSCKN